jgi:ribosomal protein S18 acetylase RimI-like enzyme
MKSKYLFSIVDTNTQKLRYISKFISPFQSDNRTLIGNLGYSATEIENQLREYRDNQPKSFFQIAQDDSGEIRGFFGIIFSDPNTLRMFGPYVTNIENEWEEISATFFKNILEKCKLWKGIKLCVAFTTKNKLLKGFYEACGFVQYNAERNLVLERHEWFRKRAEINGLSNELFEIRPYRNTDFLDFLNIHPQGAYFNAHYIVQNLNDLHSLIMAVLDDRVVGYVYYEDYKADGFTDICFLNVSQFARNRRIGTKLVKKAIEDSFKKSEIKKIEISVRVGNTAAFRLYRRLGFQETITYLAYELKF